MLPAVLSLWLATTPPLVTPPPAPPVSPLPAPVVGPIRGRAKEPLPRPSFALLFAPLSLFGLTIWAEAELPVGGGFDLFANVGGGALGQLGGDLGARYYIAGTSLEGFFFDARASAFSLPGQGFLLMGPGVLVGHSWRVQRVVISVGAGFVTWLKVASNNVGLFNNPPTDVTLMLLPGVEQPLGNEPAVQPAVRMSIGPWF